MRRPTSWPVVYDMAAQILNDGGRVSQLFESSNNLGQVNGRLMLAVHPVLPEHVFRLAAEGIRQRLFNQLTAIAAPSDFLGLQVHAGLGPGEGQAVVACLVPARNPVNRHASRAVP